MGWYYGHSATVPRGGLECGGSVPDQEKVKCLGTSMSAGGTGGNKLYTH